MSCDNDLVQCNFELPAQLLNTLNCLAKLENITASELLQLIIRQYIKDHCELDSVLMEALSKSLDKHCSLYEILAK